MRADPHSHADLEQGRVTHLSWVLTVDFEARCLHGEARLSLAEAASGPLTLDTRSLHIHAVTDADGRPLPFDLGTADPILGAPLTVHRDHPVGELVLRYRTATDASALLWLEAAQTASGRPFLLTQCQAIHARSIVPLQDTPRARITYDAAITVPGEMVPVMSAAPGARDGDTWRFDMPQPIPPYLLALAVGDLVPRDLGPRTRVFAEPSVADAAAWEFADVERMLAAAEDLFGPYRWDRYDAVVLPGAFPLGGMENPRMTFLTPTLIAGDRSLVNVLAHELAHSWTGNLVTNADNEHFWLNEGWTVYAERRILEALEGTEVAHQSAALARVRLEEQIARRHDAGQRTALTYDQAGLDPDAEFCLVPYEKGFLLLAAIEQAVGRPRFDRFTRAYIERFAFQSITTGDFLAFLAEQLPDHGVDLDPWLYEDGLPPSAPRFPVPRLDALGSAARDLPGTDPATWPRPQRVAETLYFLSQLPLLDGPTALALAEHIGLRGTRNAELRSAWLSLAIRAGVVEEAELEAFVGSVGRTKLLAPIVRALVASGRRDRAQDLRQRYASRWHVSTRQALAAV